MFKKYALGILLLVSVTRLQASQGLSFSESVMKDYRSTRHFKAFVAKLLETSNADHQDFLKQQFHDFPKLATPMSPSLSVENNLITIREGAQVATWKIVNRETGEYEINSKIVQISKWDVPSLKFEKILAELEPVAKSARFSLFSQAWAETSVGPTKSALVIYALTSKAGSEEGSLELSFARNPVENLIARLKGSEKNSCTPETVLKFTGVLQSFKLLGGTVYCHNNKDLIIQLGQKTVLKIKADGFEEIREIPTNGDGVRELIEPKISTKFEWKDGKFKESKTSRHGAAILKQYQKLASDENIKQFCSACGAFVDLKSLQSTTITIPKGRKGEK